MRRVVDFKSVQNIRSFWFMFIMNNFPEAIDDKTDKNIIEIISHNYYIDKKWVNDFVGYSEGVFEINDGYIEEPNALEIKISPVDYYCIEFYPGDTLYYLNDIEIGCTGPEYSIHKISWEKFCQYSSELSIKEKMLLLPMVIIDNREKETLFEIVHEILKVIGFHQADLKCISNAIINNCSCL